MTIWTFDDLLEKAEFDLRRVYLLRHQDTRPAKDVRYRMDYRYWLYQRKAFLEGEREQRKDVPRKGGFPCGSYMAAFVVDPNVRGAVLFVGISEVMGIDGANDRVNIYKLRRDDRLAAYEGYLVAAWGSGARSWVQRAHRQRKPILELRREFVDAEWPGYMRVSITDHEVKGLTPNRQAHLSEANGVYLLACTQTGEQYVGAAYVDGGFLGRWLAFADGGDGGNILLRRHRAEISAPMQISILEVFGSIMTEEEAFATEGRWKDALGTRAHGLNAN